MALWTAQDTADIHNLVRQGIPLQYSNPDSAMVLFREAEQLSRNTGFEDGIGYALVYRGSAATKMGNFEAAYDFYREAFPYCIRARHIRTALPSWYINAGVTLVYNGRYDLANEYYYKGLAYLQQYQADNPNIISVYNNLAAIQAKLGQHRIALDYILRAEQLSVRINNSLGLAATLVNKASQYGELRQTDSAWLSLNRALEVAREKGYTSVEQQAYITMGGLLLRERNPGEAILYYERAIALSDCTDPLVSSILPGYFLGAAWYQLKAYERARQALVSSLAKAETSGLTENRIFAHQTLASVYEATGNYRDAFHQLQNYIRLNDSLTNADRTRTINELEIKYRAAEKDRDLVQKQLLINRQQGQLMQRNIWIGGVSAGAALLVLLLIVRSRINRQKQDNQAKQIHILTQQQEIYRQEQEIDHLKAMMEGEEKERIRIAKELHDGIVSQLLAVKLHFGGTLHNKEGKILQSGDFQSTVRYLDDITKELRTTAHNLMPETLLQNGLVVALRTYCSKMSEMTATDIEFQHIGDIPGMGASIELSVYRIVQELVQNALKHAQAEHILVQVNCQEDLLSIIVEDKGIGCGEADIIESNGMGLKNIFTRVKALKGQIDFLGRKGIGTTVYMEFDKRTAALTEDKVRTQI